MIKNKNTNKFKSKSIINFLFGTLILGIFAIFITYLTEFYLKSIGLGQTPAYDKNFIYGYSLKPNQELKRINKANIIINSSGVRSSKDRRGDEKVITFLGDSVTYGGSYIDNLELFTEMICKNLQEKGFLFYCANAGVNAYGITNIVNRSKYDERLEADIYIFLIITGNFIREYRSSDTAHFYLNRNTVHFPAINEAINFLLTKYDLKKKFGKKIINSLKEEKRLEKSKKDLINHNINLLNDEINRLNSNNKKVLTLFWPDKYLDETKIQIENMVINNISNVINLKNLMEIKKNYYHDGIHLSKKGHQRLSEVISTLIID
jgi:lysophospholipase L1-like esterase